MGAPVPSSLEWDQDALLNTPIPPFYERDSSPTPAPCPEQKSARWRVLQPLSHETTDDHHAYYWGPNDPSFLTTHQLINAESMSSDEDDSVLSQFYDHSFAVHETSEIAATGIQEQVSTQESSAASEEVPIDTPSQDVSESPPFRIYGPLKDLGDIPSAKYLESIVPQTMTVNLVVGIVAVHPPRRVVTRQWKKELDIIELVVGDETRAGFGVNFWLPVPTGHPDAKAKAPGDGLARSLSTIRPRDIVLLRTVGLSSFQNLVYGQSLRGGMTQVDLLHRPDAGPYKATNVDDLPQKVRKVREWILRFVGTDEAGGHLQGMSKTHGQLPPDTQ